MKQPILEKAEKYISSVGRVLQDLRFSQTFAADEGKVKEIIEGVRNYKRDAEYFLRNNDLANGLAAICYAEGILDALRSLGIIHFEWPTDHMA